MRKEIWITMCLTLTGCNASSTQDCVGFGNASICAEVVTGVAVASTTSLSAPDGPVQSMRASPNLILSATWTRNALTVIRRFDGGQWTEDFRTAGLHDLVRIDDRICLKNSEPFEPGWCRNDAGSWTSEELPLVLNEPQAVEVTVELPAALGGGAHTATSLGQLNTRDVAFVSLELCRGGTTRTLRTIGITCTNFSIAGLLYRRSPSGEYQIWQQVPGATEALIARNNVVFRLFNGATATLFSSP